MEYTQRAFANLIPHVYQTNHDSENPSKTYTLFHTYPYIVYTIFYTVRPINIWT